MTRYTILKGIKNQQKRDEESIDAIIAQLEKNGRAITTNGQASRTLSYRLKNAKKKGQVYFSWSKPSPTDIRDEPVSVIALHPEYEIVRTSHFSVDIRPKCRPGKKKRRNNKGGINNNYIFKL